MNKKGKCNTTNYLYAYLIPVNRPKNLNFHLMLFQMIKPVKDVIDSPKPGNFEKQFKRLYRYGCNPLLQRFIISK